MRVKYNFTLTKYNYFSNDDDDDDEYDEGYDDGYMICNHDKSAIFHNRYISGGTRKRGQMHIRMFTPLTTEVH